MASTLFRSLSQRVLDRKRFRRTTPPPTAIAPATVLVPAAAIEEAVEEVEQPVMFPDGLPATEASPPSSPTSGVSPAVAAVPTPPQASIPRRRHSIFNRLQHSRNSSAESTATTASSRSTASTLAISISSGATTLSRSVSTRARAAKRRSADFMAIPMYEGVLVEDDNLSLKDQDGAAASFDIIL